MGRTVTNVLGNAIATAVVASGRRHRPGWTRRWPSVKSRCRWKVKLPAPRTKPSWRCCVTFAVPCCTVCGHIA